MFSYGNDLCVKPSVRELFGAAFVVIYTRQAFETILKFSRGGNNGIFNLKI